MVLHYEELDVETKVKLGLPAPHKHQKVPQRVSVLGKVLHSLGKLTRSDARWVIEQAMMTVSGGNGNTEPLVGAESIIKVVATEFGATTVLLKHRNRTARVALARQVSMYVLSRTNSYTLEQIGKALGGRSPATVSHGFQSVARRIETEPMFRGQMKEILKLIGVVER